SEDGLPGARQHELQRARRADDPVARRRAPLFPPHRHGLPRPRTAAPREVGAACAPRGREDRRAGDGLMTDDTIGLPPPKDAPRGDVTSADLWKARGVNLF